MSNNEIIPHVSVLPNEIKDLIKNFVHNNLNNKFIPVAIDFTFGAGGHSKIILDNWYENGKIVAIDRDPYTEIFAKDIKEKYKNKFEYYNDISSNMAKYILDNEKVKFILGDLGLSQMQLNNKRGFAYRDDSDLDMQMGVESLGSLSNFLKTLSAFKIGEILREYGEEPSWKKIANTINENKNNINTTGDLKKIIESIVHKKEINKSLSRCFQAFRIFINNELSILEDTLKNAYDLLDEGGMLAIITFHSLEDRIVKQFFKEFLYDTSIIYPSENEINLNSQSRSAKLRIGKKILTN
jgi:16S rRNA (cytosine1402-N4)-methyltransferase